MTTQNPQPLHPPQAPPGFKPLNAAESTGPRIKRESLTQGVIVQYRGKRIFPRAANDTTDRTTTTVQIFVARGGKGARFSTFGTAQLDSKLESVAPGAILWIAYSGKKLLDGQETHDWNISDAGNRLNDVQLAKLLANSEREHLALDNAIRAAESENAARAHSAGPSDGPPLDSYDDNDAEAAGAR